MSAPASCEHGIRRLGQYLVEMPPSAFELTPRLQPRRSGPRRQACCAPRPQTSMVRFSAPDYTPGVEFRVFVAAVRDEVAAKDFNTVAGESWNPWCP